MKNLGLFGGGVCATLLLTWAVSVAAPNNSAVIRSLNYPPAVHLPESAFAFTPWQMARESGPRWVPIPGAPPLPPGFRTGFMTWAPPPAVPWSPARDSATIGFLE